MSRYFLEMRYMGTRYSGFQIQENAITIQSETEKALQVLLRQPIALTGSSRTDAGVHALQNYFHFDLEYDLKSSFVYNVNAILPPDIAIRSIIKVKDDAHCRFHATSRAYAYHIYREKDPMKADRAWFYPFSLNVDLLQRVAAIIKEYDDFTSFSKRNTQVKTFNCQIIHSAWEQTEDGLIYRVEANRFLRGMVRGLVGTMLQVGRGKLTEQNFRDIITAHDCTKADFSTPAHGLFLETVRLVDGLIN
ncbi:MAG: tRNA pseudouridine(38-40) synthase TruA [Sphingobacteriales bacterium]|jgi:tRNA pseudouridine38-40 synthase